MVKKQTSDYLEQTLILIKPDGVQRGLVGEILHRFERMGLRIVGMKMIHASEEHASKHYPNTEEWLRGMGEKSLKDCETYELDAKEIFNTNDTLEIGKIIAGYNVKYISSSPVIAVVLEGYHAIAAVRKLVGHTLPLLADPGTIRGDYSSFSSVLGNVAHKSILNLIHASGNKKEATYEINHWFESSELYNYQHVHKIV